MVTVTLSQADRDRADLEADERYNRTVGIGNEPSMIHKRTPTEQHAIWRRSCAAELAVAIHLDAEWLTGYNGPASFDVAPYIEVRSTRPGGSLYIKNRELQAGPYEKPPYTRYFLTWIGDNLEMVTLAGWITLGDAIRHLTPHDHQGRRYGYWVDQRHLWPVETYPNRPKGR